MALLYGEGRWLPPMPGPTPMLKAEAPGSLPGASAVDQDELLDCDALGEVAGLVHVVALGLGEFRSEDLQRDGGQQRHEHVFYIPETPTLLAPLLATVPLQIFALALASAKGYDVDQPRNLAKSVTVE